MRENGDEEVKEGLGETDGVVIEYSPPAGIKLAYLLPLVQMAYKAKAK